MKKVYVETPKFLNHFTTSRSRLFLSFGENVLARLSKLLSMSPSEHFEEKKFLKKCFINSGLYEKNLKFDIKKFGNVVKSEFYTSKTTIS